MKEEIALVVNLLAIYVVYRLILMHNASGWYSNKHSVYCRCNIRDDP